MKTCFFTIVFSFVLCYAVFAQTQKQKIADIDKAKQEIKYDLGNFRQIDDRKDSNGFRDAYADDKELKLVTVFVKDKNINKHVAWYFSNGQLIYAEQNWQNNETNRLIDNEKLYVSDGHLIQFIINDSPINDTTKEFKHADNTIIDYGKKLVSAYRNKLKAKDTK